MRIGKKVLTYEQYWRKLQRWRKGKPKCTNCRGGDAGYFGPYREKDDYRKCEKCDGTGYLHDIDDKVPRRFV